MKNKLVVVVTTKKFYEYQTTALSEDVAFDEFINQTGRKFKKVNEERTEEIFEWTPAPKKAASKKNHRGL